MYLFTSSGRTYQIINRENIEKDGVYVHKYVLLGSVEARYITTRPKPGVSDYEEIKVNPKDFVVGDHIIFCTKDANGNVDKKKIHIMAPIKKIKQSPTSRY